ncbi:condensin complex [Salix suchowensis]|nr:condensin complex [Salix suchowensis]
MGLYFNIKKTLLKAFDLVDFTDAGKKNMELLDFLYSGFDTNDWGDDDTEENETMIQAPLYAKLMENEGENGSTQSTVSVEKGLVKEFKQMAERLESVDEQPEEELLQHRAEFISEAWE